MHDLKDHSRFLLLILFTLMGVTDVAADRPNFVFLLVDDLRADGTGLTGHPYASTPNIDRIGEEGMVFTNAHVTTPLCSPSRASFLYGRYARSHGVANNWPREPDPAIVPSFPSLLRADGYQTAFIGKWHQGFGNHIRPGFDFWASFSGQGNYVGTPDQPIKIRFVNQTVDRLDVYTAGEYNTDILTDYASSWLQQVAGPGQDSPFCLLLWYKAVHGPRTPASRHAQLYDGQHYRPLSLATTSPLSDGKPALVAEAIDSWNDRSVGAQEAVVDAIALRDQRTLAAVDESVGRLFDQLVQLEILDQTVVVFVSDNGYFFYEFGLGDKRWLYEPSTRVPFFVRAPSLASPGSSSDFPVLNIDLAPTLLDLAGVEVPSAMQGRSLRGILEHTITRPEQWRTTWLNEYHQDQPFVVYDAQSVSTVASRGSFKHIRYPWRQHENEIYDLADDPSERWNLHPFHSGGEFWSRADLEEEVARLGSEAAGAFPIGPHLDCYYKARLDGGTIDSGLDLRLVEPPDGVLEPVVINGRNARRAPPDSFMYFDVIDGWATSRAIVDITLTFLDNGSGQLWLQFDSEGEAQGPYSGPYRRTQSVEVAGTDSWRQHTFSLTDVRFDGRQNMGADFRVARSSADPIVVDTVSLDAPPPDSGAIDLGDQDEYRFLYRVEVPQGATDGAFMAGRHCRTNRDPSQDHVFAFDVAAEVAEALRSAPIVISVEFYDQGSGRLRLEYDGQDGLYSEADVVSLTDTRRWRTHSFRIADAHFAGRQLGDSDFRLATDHSPLFLDRVELSTLASPRRPGPRRSPEGATYPTEARH